MDLDTRGGLADRLRRLARLLKLSPRDWLFLLEALGELLRTDTRLRLLPYARWRARLARATAPAQLADPWPAAASNLVRLFAAVAHRYPGGATCLVRALSLHELLRRRGHSTSLQLGVRQGAPDDKMSVEAHAWLERGGRVIYDPPDPANPYLTFGPLR